MNLKAWLILETICMAMYSMENENNRNKIWLIQGECCFYHDIPILVIVAVGLVFTALSEVDLSFSIRDS